MRFETENIEFHSQFTEVNMEFINVVGRGAGITGNISIL